MNCQENGLNTVSEQCLKKDFYTQLLSTIFDIWLLKSRLFCSLPIMQVFPLSSRAELLMQKVMKKESHTIKCYILKAATPSFPTSTPGQLVHISITSVHMQLKSRLWGTWQHLSSQACHSPNPVAFWPALQYKRRSQKCLVLFDLQVTEMWKCTGLHG